MPLLRGPSLTLPRRHDRAPTFSIDDFQRLVSDAFDLHKDAPPLPLNVSRQPHTISHSHTRSQSRTNTLTAETAKSYFDGEEDDDGDRRPDAHARTRLRPEVRRLQDRERPRSHSFSFVQRVLHHDQPDSPSKPGVASRVFKTLRTRASAFVLRPSHSHSQPQARPKTQDQRQTAENNISTHGNGQEDASNAANGLGNSAGHTHPPVPARKTRKGRSSSFSFLSTASAATAIATKAARPESQLVRFPSSGEGSVPSTPIAKDAPRVRSPFPFVEVSVSFHPSDASKKEKERRRTSSLPLHFFRLSSSTPSPSPSPAPLLSDPVSETGADIEPDRTKDKLFPRSSTPTPLFRFSRTPAATCAPVPAHTSTPTPAYTDPSTPDPAYMRTGTPGLSPAPPRVHTRLPALNSKRSRNLLSPLLGLSTSASSSARRTHGRQKSTATMEGEVRSVYSPVDPVAYGLGLEFGAEELEGTDMGREKCPSPYRNPRAAPKPPSSTGQANECDGEDADPEPPRNVFESERRGSVGMASVFSDVSASESGPSSTSTKSPYPSTDAVQQTQPQSQRQTQTITERLSALPLPLSLPSPLGLLRRARSKNHLKLALSEVPAEAEERSIASSDAGESLPPTPCTPSFPVDTMLAPGTPTSSHSTSSSSGKEKEGRGFYGLKALTRSKANLSLGLGLGLSLSGGSSTEVQRGSGPNESRAESVMSTNHDPKRAKDWDREKEREEKIGRVLTPEEDPFKKSDVEVQSSPPVSPEKKGGGRHRQTGSVDTITPTTSIGGGDANAAEMSELERVGEAAVIAQHARDEGDLPEMQRARPGPHPNPHPYGSPMAMAHAYTYPPPVAPFALSGHPYANANTDDTRANAKTGKDKKREKKTLTIRPVAYGYDGELMSSSGARAASPVNMRPTSPTRGLSSTSPAGAIRAVSPTNHTFASLPPSPGPPPNVALPSVPRSPSASPALSASSGTSSSPSSASSALSPRTPVSPFLFNEPPSPTVMARKPLASSPLVCNAPLVSSPLATVSPLSMVPFPSAENVKCVRRARSGASLQGGEGEWERPPSPFPFPMSMGVQQSSGARRDRRAERSQRSRSNAGDARSSTGYFVEDLQVALDLDLEQLAALNLDDQGMEALRSLSVEQLRRLDVRELEAVRASLLGELDALSARNETGGWVRGPRFDRGRGGEGVEKKRWPVPPDGFGPPRVQPSPNPHQCKKTEKRKQSFVPFPTSATGGELDRDRTVRAKPVLKRRDGREPQPLQYGGPNPAYPQAHVHGRMNTVRATQSDSALRVRARVLDTHAQGAAHARAHTHEGSQTAGDVDLERIEERWEGQRTGRSTAVFSYVHMEAEVPDAQGRSTRSMFYSAHSRSSVWSSVSAAFGAFGQPVGEEAADAVRSLSLASVPVGVGEDEGYEDGVEVNAI